jgi:hypothetical protein
MLHIKEIHTVKCDWRKLAIFILYVQCSLSNLKFSDPTTPVIQTGQRQQKPGKEKREEREREIERFYRSVGLRAPLFQEAPNFRELLFRSVVSHAHAHTHTLVVVVGGYLPKSNVGVSDHLVINLCAV